MRCSACLCGQTMGDDRSALRLSALIPISRDRAKIKPGVWVSTPRLEPPLLASSARMPPTSTVSSEALRRVRESA